MKSAMGNSVKAAPWRICFSAEVGAELILDASIIDIACLLLFIPGVTLSPIPCP
jgi:hypothetical protein